MAEDLHIFRDVQAYRLFKDTGGGGNAIFYGQNFAEALLGREVRDIYLHGLGLTSDELRLLKARQRHSFSHAIYGVTEMLE